MNTENLKKEYRLCLTNIIFRVIIINMILLMIGIFLEYFKTSFLWEIVLAVIQETIAGLIVGISLWTNYHFNTFRCINYDMTVGELKNKIKSNLEA